MRDAEKIIKFVSIRMRGMLASVLTYNEIFLKKKKQEKLLERILFAISVIDRRFFYRGREVLRTPRLRFDAGMVVTLVVTLCWIQLRQMQQMDITEGGRNAL